MRRIALIVLCGVSLAVASPALAASPSSSAYSGVGATQISRVPGSNTQTNASTSSTLPFTGLNVGVVGVVAVVLMGSGLFLRRRTGLDRS